MEALELLAMNKWKGKLAVVTGASSGIGYAVALELTKHGVNVAAMARRTDRLKELEVEAQGQNGKLKSFYCDVTKEETLKEALAAAEKSFGPVHILFNNAGVLCSSTVYDLSTEELTKMVNTNITGLTLTFREAVTSMRKNDVRGHIFNVSSVVGNRNVFGSDSGVYTATKHAVNSLSEFLRFELNSNKIPIKVTNFCPGLVKSEMSDAFEKKFSCEVMLTPEEIASTVILVLSTGPNTNISNIAVQHLMELF